MRLAVRRRRPYGAHVTDVLDIQTHDHLRVLRLNRPERKNALNRCAHPGHRGRGFARRPHDDDVWAIAITGNGDAFCSGLDLAVIGDDDGDRRGRRRRPTTGRRPDRLHFAYAMRAECEKPDPRGGERRGGRDRRVARDGRGLPPRRTVGPVPPRLRCGVRTSPDGGLTWTLPEAVGYERAMRFFLESAHG